MKRKVSAIPIPFALLILLTFVLGGHISSGRAMRAENPRGNGATPGETPSIISTVETGTPELSTLAATATLTETAIEPAVPTETPSTTELPAGTLSPAGDSAVLTSLTANDWPQVQKNAQHTGYANETLGTNISVAWTHAFQPEKVFPQVQAIVASGKVFVGTESGTLYAFQVDNGAQAWKYSAGGPILNSVATDGTRVYFGAMDGAVYAVSVDSGALVWRSPVSRRKGLSTAPVIADNQVMLGGRDGNFYSFNPENGQINWQYSAGAPILQTAAANNGKVYFTAMDMHAYALQTSNGSLAWRSQPIAGAAFKDYWPVVTNNSLLLRPVPTNTDAGILPDFPFLWFENATQWNWLAQNGSLVAQGRLADIPDAMNAQANVLQRYANNPGSFVRSLFILNEANGAEDFVVPHWSGQTMGGGTTPPCVDSTGNLIVPVTFIRGGWGRLNLNSRRIIDILYDGRDGNGSPVDVNHFSAAGMGNPDETLNPTCTRNLILGMHTMEENANYTGAFDLVNRRWYHISSGARNKEMSTNTQGGGGNPASVSNGKIFHITFDELIVRNAQP